MKAQAGAFNPLSAGTLSLHSFHVVAVKDTSENFIVCLHQGFFPLALSSFTFGPGPLYPHPVLNWQIAVESPPLHFLTK